VLSFLPFSKAVQTQQLNRKQRDLVLQRISATHRQRPLFIDLGLISNSDVISNALSFLNLSTSIKIKVSGENQGLLLSDLLTIATLNKTCGKYNIPRSLTISLVLQNITTKFFNTGYLLIPIFIESLFNKEHVELVSLTFDNVKFSFNGKEFYYKLMNVNDLTFKNSFIKILRILKPFDRIESLVISSSSIDGLI
jgi:hypothetical protein